MGSERKRFLKALMAAALSGAMAMGPCAGGVALADEPIGAQAEMPARYDLREQGVVTPVKYQNPFGTCWAFGGIAAAETSILSDSGTTFAQTPLDLSEKHLAWFALQPVTEAENKEQAGEGIHVEVEGDMTQTSAVYNFGGYPIYVTSLFSSGTGPMLEETFPYQGNEAILERDYCLSHFDELLETSVKAYAELHPELDDATIRDLADKELKAKIEELRIEDYYAAEDDWTIPATDKNGDSNRNVFGGYTLRDGNVLPDLAIRGDVTDEALLGKWLGLSESGLRAMKQEMLNGRAISILFYADTSEPGEVENGEYLNLDNWSQYTFDDTGTNHAVCIVGWDDNYPAQNFTHKVYHTDENGNQVVDEARSKLTTPPGNGAWIVKNSWGSETDAVKGGFTASDGTKEDANRSDWGVRNDAGEATGYFYLSYYDKSVDMCETMDFDRDLDQSDEGFYALQYDYMPSAVDFWELRSYDNITSANVFTADETSLLHSVSTRTFEENTRVTFKVYRLSAEATNPEDGELVASLSKNYEYAGFHRVDLSQPISLKKGERFSVVACNTTVDAAGRRIFGVEASQALAKGFIDEDEEPEGVICYSIAVVNPGESYLQLGQNWVDWADYQKTEEFKKTAVFKLGDEVRETCVDNFAIKAYLLPAK